ncbi:Brix domain-containing protein [Porphyridium purpureum]|uniref:Brix domain-containing protein n=1 Tax=Porphyridium purpureum TaxID=35688 RepID=A0A5J4YSY4_PORPP|nr:Brix domain-containing protein [Porphyridium purpureum]|eukprot:POR0207..scf229_5
MKMKEKDGDGAVRTSRASQVNEVRNKAIRRGLIEKERTQKKRDKKQRQEERRQQRKALGESAPPKLVPDTIDNTREYDETLVTAEKSAVLEEQQLRDEFAAVFQGEQTPHVLITTGLKPKQVTYGFVQELLYVIPNSVYYERKSYDIKEVVKYSAMREFSDVLVVKDDHKQLTALIHIHLAAGPTAVYRLSSYIPARNIHGHGTKTSHQPELILNRFTTGIGHRVGRMLGALFPHEPNFKGRQVVTLHNQRDFIFFRFHRYMFNDKGSGARLQELGPRFTLRLQSMQRGAFDRDGEYEFVRQKKGSGSKLKFSM